MKLFISNIRKVHFTDSGDFIQQNFNYLTSFQMKKIILSVAILATCLTACKKKSDDPAPVTTKTTTEYLTAHSWKTSGSVSNVAIDADDDANTPATTDIWNQNYDVCEKDDNVNFAANGTGTYTDAGITCNPTGSFSFTWTLTGNNIEVTSTFDPGTGPITNTSILKIISIDDNTLKVNLEDNTDPNGVVYVETNTFIK